MRSGPPTRSNNRKNAPLRRMRACRRAPRRRPGLAGAGEVGGPSTDRRSGETVRPATGFLRRGRGVRRLRGRTPRLSSTQRAHWPQSLQHCADPWQQQASLPPLQQQDALAQQPLPPPLVTQELRVSMATPEAATRSRFRMVFMVFCFLVILVLVCCESPEPGSGELAGDFAEFFSDVATQGFAELDLRSDADLGDDLAHRSGLSGGRARQGARHRKVGRPGMESEERHDVS